MKAFVYFRKKAGANHGGNAKAQQLAVFTGLLHGAAQGIGLFKQAFCRAKQQFTLIAKRKAAAFSGNQRYAKFVFQLFNGAGDGRLRNMQRLRGLCNIAETAGGAKIFQL